MKIALYIEDGLDQIVLTPQSAIEKSILLKLEEQTDITIRRGSFYECNGGWTREGGREESVIIILRKNTVPQ